MIFLTGGARSGKSSLAVALARRHDGPVRYIATASPEDEEMESRIASHRRSRPESWTVVEAPLELGKAVGESARHEMIVIDCVTLWISNLMVDTDDEDILRRVDEVVETLTARTDPSIVVSNEVGSGLVPMNLVGRRFRDLHGTANQAFAAASDQAYLVVAGRPLTLGSIDD